MNDLPYAVLSSRSPVLPLRLPSYPRRLALLPKGVTLATLAHDPMIRVIWTVDAGGAREILNGRALAGYIADRVPVIFYAHAARELRPFLRRAEDFRARGYVIEMAP